MAEYFRCNKCNGTFDPAHTYCPNCDGAVVKQLEAENAALKAELIEEKAAHFKTHNWLIDRNEELAAAQTDAKRRIEAAWRDGYQSLSTYNDVDMSDEDTCWKDSNTYDAIAKEQS